MLPSTTESQSGLGIQIPADTMDRAIHDAVVEYLATNPQIDAAVAESIRVQTDLLSPQQAAEMIGVTTRTLNDNHVPWGLDKFVGLGPTNPKYSKSQITQRIQSRVIRGKRPANVSPFKSEPDWRSDPDARSTQTAGK